MVGTNKMTINHATMLQVINKWLGASFSDAHRPKCVNVTASTKHTEGFVLVLQSEEVCDDASKTSN